MKLSELLTALPQHTVTGPDDVDVTGVAYDSRKVQPGHLFCCIENNGKDGHVYAAAAIAAGAVGVVVSRPLEVRAARIQVPNATRALALLASRFYGDPSHHMTMVGVTGTNGKTTTTYMIESILEAAGRRPGVIGTVGVKMNGKVEDARNTTPLALELQHYLYRMREHGHDSAVMEVSSHGLALDRVYGIPYDVGVFTNLTQDHLDFHGTMEDYAAAKHKLFLGLGHNNPKTGPRGAVLNADDEYLKVLSANVIVPIVTYGIKHGDVRATNVRNTRRGTHYHVHTPNGEADVNLRTVGTFMVYNSLAALTAGLVLEIPLETIVAGLEKVPPVRGRFEQIDIGQEYCVVVDYAHTPDGLQNVLQAARELTPGRLIAVFGCGGDRDRSKRPVMGRIAAELADHVVITSDNPRTEEPQRILADIEAGVKGIARSYEVEVDRAAAIAAALEGARAGDTVVIAGKGHETYQIFKDRTIHFDDAEVAREWLGARCSR